LAISIGFQDQKHFLSPIHQVSLQCALECGRTTYALPLIENLITDLDPVGFGIDMKDFLLYHYYGGMIFLSVKNYRTAIMFFSLALHAPGQVPSAIQIETYKKFILASLIQKGKFQTLPSYVAMSVLKVLDNAATHYAVFADAFETCSFSKLATLVSSHSNEYSADGNLGLINQCLDQVVVMF
jgi:COP9 signalosome complex subunit 3